MKEIKELVRHVSYDAYSANMRRIGIEQETIDDLVDQCREIDCDEPIVSYIRSYLKV